MLQELKEVRELVAENEVKDVGWFFKNVPSIANKPQKLITKLRQ